MSATSMIAPKRAARMGHWRTLLVETESDLDHPQTVAERHATDAGIAVWKE